MSFITDTQSKADNSPRRPAALRAAAAAALMLLAGASAHAALVQMPSEGFAGTGLGAVNTVLTMQSRGSSSFESASVGIDAVSNQQFIAGDALRGASQTRVRTLAELGIGSAADLRVVFNANEPGGNDINLDNLVLTIYSASGSILFSSGGFAPVSFADTLTGVGKAGFVFGLDATDAAAAQAAAFSGNFGLNRVGLSASASAATGGFETFHVAAAPVPEPSSLALMLGGAGLIGGIAMRRRKAAAQA